MNTRIALLVLSLTALQPYAALAQSAANAGATAGVAGAKSFSIQDSDARVRDLLGNPTLSHTGRINGTTATTGVFSASGSLRCEVGRYAWIGGVGFRVDACNAGQPNGPVASMTLSTCDRPRHGMTCDLKEVTPAHWSTVLTFTPGSPVTSGPYRLEGECTGLACSLRLQITESGSYQSNNLSEMEQKGQQMIVTQGGGYFGAQLSQVLNSGEFIAQLRNQEANQNCYTGQMNQLLDEGKISDCAGVYTLTFGTVDQMQACGPSDGVSYEFNCSVPINTTQVDCQTTRTCHLERQSDLVPCATTISMTTDRMPMYARSSGPYTWTLDPALNGYSLGHVPPNCRNNCSTSATFEIRDLNAINEFQINWIWFDRDYGASIYVNDKLVVAGWCGGALVPLQEPDGKIVGYQYTKDSGLCPVGSNDPRVNPSTYPVLYYQNDLPVYPASGGDTRQLSIDVDIRPYLVEGTNRFTVRWRDDDKHTQADFRARASWTFTPDSIFQANDSCAALPK